MADKQLKTAAKEFCEAEGIGAKLINEERKRQIEVKGFDSKHDELSSRWNRPNQRILNGSKLKQAASAYEKNSVHLWPWGKEYWKPTPDNFIRQLTKAGALYKAEADRLNEYIKTGKYPSEVKDNYDDCIKAVNRCINKINNY